MRITQVRVGRTYNTLNYTSQRFELEADIEEDDDPDMACAVLSIQLHRNAVAALRALGIARIFEQHGEVPLFPADALGKGDDDEIPF